MLNNTCISKWFSFVLLLVSFSVQVEGQYCRSTGHFRALSPPPGQCTYKCCVENNVYFTFECSPLVTPQTEGILALKSFQNSQSKCNNTNNHSDRSLVVALSTGWYNGGARCGNRIVIRGNRQIVVAKVVDECDSTKGCNAEEGYHPPCGRDIVAASMAVWQALGIPQRLWGAPINIKWADAGIIN
uniref:Uncharacterized protein n=2 Tax=Chenopodium quinoa TaxID=63459 RepID=A0A803KQ50_CHEQI